MVKRLTHLNQKGKATMVDVGPKFPQFRRAVAKGENFDHIKILEDKNIDVFVMSKISTKVFEGKADSFGKKVITDKMNDRAYICYDSKDFSIGYKSFLTKTKPEFKNK